MTSPAKIAANRRNARRSTGPRSTAGKARARRNAFRHGLATPASVDHVATDRIDELVDALTRDFSRQLEYELATVAAKHKLKLNVCGKPRSLWSTAPPRSCAMRGLVCRLPASAPHWRSLVRLRSSWPASAMNAVPSRDAIGRCRRWQGSNENYRGRRRWNCVGPPHPKSQLTRHNPFHEDVLRLQVGKLMGSSLGPNFSVYL